MPLFMRPQFGAVMARMVGEYRSHRANEPLLCVAASQADDGALRLFDSDTQAIGVRHLQASTAIPLLYEQAEVDGRRYWDGEMNRRSMVGPMLQRLKALHRLQPGEPLRLVTVEQMVVHDDMPDAGAAIADAAFAMLQAGKLSPDEIDWDGPVQWVQVCRRANEQEGISGRFDASPERIAALVADGMQAARQAWAAPQSLGQHAPAAEHALP